MLSANSSNYNKFGARSSMYFAILLIVATGVTLFILNKAQEAMREIRSLQEQSIITARQMRENIEGKER